MLAVGHLRIDQESTHSIGAVSLDNGLVSFEAVFVIHIR